MITQVYECRFQKRASRRRKWLLKQQGFFRVRKNLWRAYQFDDRGFVYQLYFGSEAGDVMTTRVSR